MNLFLKMSAGLHLVLLMFGNKSEPGFMRFLGWVGNG
jgi:hypothetical protein